MSVKKSIGLLIGGTALAQIFTFAISPILTRLYSPESFGLLGTVLAASSIIAASSHLRLNLAIAQAKKINESILVLKTAIILSLIICFISSLFIYCGSLFFNGNYTLAIVALIFILSFSNSLIDIFNYWQSYKGQHKLSARNAVVRSFSTGIPQIVFGFFNSFGLVFGVILGSIVSLILFLREFIQAQKKSKINISKKRIIFILNKYKDFPLYSMPQGLIASLSLNSVPIILGAKFGIAVAGQYWLAYRILLAPIALIGGAYRQVLHPLFSSKSLRLKDKKKICDKHTIFLLVSIIPLISFSLLFLEEIFIRIFGAEWILAGQFAGFLIICFSLDIVKVPIYSLATAIGFQKKLLLSEVILGCSRILIVLLSFIQTNAVQTIKFFSIISLIIILLSIIYFNFLFKGKIIDESK